LSYHQISYNIAPIPQSIF